MQRSSAARAGAARYSVPNVRMVQCRKGRCTFQEERDRGGVLWKIERAEGERAGAK